MKKLILSSASPRRRELLEQIGAKFDIIISDVDENIKEDLNPGELVKKLALMKAQNVYEKTDMENSVVIGADTVVVFEGTILGKPDDAEEAFEMLKMLSGKVNSVYTGVAVLAKGKKINFYEETKVYMKNISECDIRAYISTGEPMDKAGAYAIQGMGAVLVEKIFGDYNNVVGLPIAKLYEIVKEIDEELISWD